MGTPLEHFSRVEFITSLVEFGVPRKSNIGKADLNEVGMEILLTWREAKGKTVGRRGQQPVSGSVESEGEGPAEGMKTLCALEVRHNLGRTLRKGMAWNKVGWTMAAKSGSMEDGEFQEGNCQVQRSSQREN